METQQQEAVGLWIKAHKAANKDDLQWAGPIEKSSDESSQAFMAKVVESLAQAKKQSDLYLTAIIQEKNGQGAKPQ